MSSNYRGVTRDTMEADTAQRFGLYRSLGLSEGAALIQAVDDTVPVDRFDAEARVMEAFGASSASARRGVADRYGHGSEAAARQHLAEAATPATAVAPSPKANGQRWTVAQFREVRQHYQSAGMTVNEAFDAATAQEAREMVVPPQPTTTKTPAPVALTEADRALIADNDATVRRIFGTTTTEEEADMARTRTRVPDEVTAPPVPAATEREHVAALAASVTHWQDEATAARAELAAHEGDAGRQLLDEETTADALATSHAGLTGRIRTAEAARDEAQRRLELARKATLLAIADDLERAADAAKARGEAHTAKLRPLLEQLQDLDGRSYRALTDKEEASRVHVEQGGTGQPYDVAFTLSRGQEIAREEARVRHRAEQVRARAVDGMDAEQYDEAVSFAENRLAELDPAAAPAAA